jgi:hypothetical protein
MIKRIPCVECSKPTARIHPILDTPLCRKCQASLSSKYKYISKIRAMQEFRLKANDLEKLRFHAVDNPHYKVAAPMRLYLLKQIEELSKDKWGSRELYLVGMRNITTSLLAYLCEDIERLKQLSAEQFQYLIADRLEQWRLGVQIVGHVNRMDGGIDIIAYPRTPSIPFLLAVQAKHHRLNRKTSVGDVRDFYGAITSRANSFHFGIVVTNTAFTPNAQFFAECNKTLLRLRDASDLRRWLNNDFDNPFEWRELPSKVLLAPGVEIEIPRPTLILPSWYKR